jgi:hypothetical protein
MRKEEKRRLNEGMKKTRARMGDSSEVVHERTSPRVVVPAGRKGETGRGVEERTLAGRRESALLFSGD